MSMKFLIKTNLSKYINDNIDEVDIFSKYLGIPATEIYKCINDKSYRVNNPLRNDRNPSLGFQYLRAKHGHKLYGKDFANPFFVGDCYHFVGITLGLNSNLPRDFLNICKDIIDKLDNTKTTTSVSTKKFYISQKKENKVVRIDIEKRKWNAKDLLYWYNYGIKPNTLVINNVYPVNKFWINDILQDYYYTPDNPCFAYYLGARPNVLWEIYRPYEEDYNKFRVNECNDIKELHTVTDNVNLILTKSKKDKLLLIQMIEELGIIDTDVLYTSESTRLKKKTLLTIKESYKNIFVNFDVDKAGIRGMKFFNSTYGFSLFPFITENMSKIKGYPKDVSDFSKQYGYNNTLRVFSFLYNKYISL